MKSRWQLVTHLILFVLDNVGAWDDGGGVRSDGPGNGRDGQKHGGHVEPDHGACLPRGSRVRWR